MKKILASLSAACFVMAFAAGTMACPPNGKASANNAQVDPATGTVKVCAPHGKGKACCEKSGKGCTHAKAADKASAPQPAPANEQKSEAKPADNSGGSGSGNSAAPKNK